MAIANMGANKGQRFVLQEKAANLSIYLDNKLRCSNVLREHIVDETHPWAIAVGNIYPFVRSEIEVGKMLAH